MAGVRSAHAALLLAAVERDDVRRQLFAPELLFEPGAKLLRVVAQAISARRVAERVRDRRGVQLRVVHVRLHLAERDGRLGQRAVREKDRILRVFPSLLHEPRGRSPCVLDEEIAVAVAVAIDPFHRALDVRP